MHNTTAAVKSSDLPRRLGAIDATAIIIGIVIGGGIFVLPNVVARNAPSYAAIVSVWIAGGILSFCGALAYAELGSMLPATGGQYVYLREAYGPRCAFISNWTFMFAVISGGNAWLAVTFAIYVGYFVPLTPIAAKAVSVALIFAVAAINYVGVKEAAWVQRTFTWLKVAAVAILIAGAFLHKGSLAPAHAPAPHVSGFGVALAACLMAYNGWSYVSFVAGEVRDPQRNLLRALVVGMTAVTALYLFANLAYLRVMTIPEIAASDRVGADAATRIMGPIGATFVSVAVLVSVIGAVNGCTLTGARIPFAQARDGLFFRAFGIPHPRFESPALAIVCGAVWTAGLVITGSYDTLYSYTILAGWIFYTLSVAAVLILRRRMPEAPRPYRMWGYPWTLGVFVLASIWFIVDSMFTQPLPAAGTLVVIGAGAIAYELWNRFRWGFAAQRDA
jgi:APA family basic amino acid/polyamine antiporter